MSLIARHTGVDLQAPGVDPAGHVLGLRKPLLAKELRHPQAPAAVMAMHDHSSRLVRPAPRSRLGISRIGMCVEPAILAVATSSGSRQSSSTNFSPPSSICLTEATSISMGRSGIGVQSSGFGGQQDVDRIDRLPCNANEVLSALTPTPILGPLTSLISDPMTRPDPTPAREFAVEVVRRLRAAGHEAPVGRRLRARSAPGTAAQGL